MAGGTCCCSDDRTSSARDLHCDVTDTASLDGAYAPGATVDDFANNRVPFVPLLPEQRLRPHRRHLIGKGLAKHAVLTHVRLKIFPDGGVSRLRLYGRPRQG